MGEHISIDDVVNVPCKVYEVDDDFILVEPIGEATSIGYDVASGHKWIETNTEAVTLLAKSIALQYLPKRPAKVRVVELRNGLLLKLVDVKEYCPWQVLDNPNNIDELKVGMYTKPYHLGYGSAEIIRELK